MSAESGPDMSHYSDEEIARSKATTLPLEASDEMKQLIEKGPESEQ